MPSHKVRLWTVFRYDAAMKRVSIQDLNAPLSALVAAAESGDTVLITETRRNLVRLAREGAINLDTSRNQSARELGLPV
jgi:hypothetical protein